MKTLEVVMNPTPPRPWVETVDRGLNRHNIAATGFVEFYPVRFLIKDAGSEIRGGLLGGIWGRWLHIGSLWVHRMSRGRGYATGLMEAAEEYGLRKNCVGAFLQTGSYEARPLYEKLGYSVFASLSDHPVKGHSRFFMSKQFSGARDRPRASIDATLVMDPYSSHEVEEVIRRGIQTHAHAAIGLPEETWSAANFFLQSEAGEILGGALGNTWGRWYFLAELWVDRPLRGQGHAQRLVAAAEQHAIQRGCTNAFLDTFSFQARPFYEKFGYTVFGVLEEHPVGHRHFYLSKRLGP